jgi:hypothetical protein
VPQERLPAAALARFDLTVPVYATQETESAIVNANATMSVSEAENNDPSPWALDFARRVCHEITTWDAAAVQVSSQQTFCHHVGLYYMRSPLPGAP